MTDKRTFKEAMSKENDSQEVLDTKESDAPQDNAMNSESSNVAVCDEGATEFMGEDGFAGGVTFHASSNLLTLTQSCQMGLNLSSQFELPSQQTQNRNSSSNSNDAQGDHFVNISSHFDKESLIRDHSKSSGNHHCGNKKGESLLKAINSNKTKSKTKR